jgi:hypothetical protein
LAGFYSGVWLIFIREFGRILFGSLADFYSGVWPDFIREFG